MNSHYLIFANWPHGDWLMVYSAAQPTTLKARAKPYAETTEARTILAVCPLLEEKTKMLAPLRDRQHIRVNSPLKYHGL